MTFMRDPLIRAFRSSTISAANLISDSEQYGKDFGNVRPGSTYDDFGLWWYNIGGASAIDAPPSRRLKLETTASSTADAGLAADTTAAWRFGQDTAHLLSPGLEATPAYTVGWPVPMPSPFPIMSASGPWQCGLRWAVPLTATLGKIRKSFRISGRSYEGWDYIWSCNPFMLLYPWDSLWSYPLLRWGCANFSIGLDAASPTGARLVCARTATDYSMIGHTQTTSPWKSVSNATGWRLLVKMATNAVAGTSALIHVVDGIYNLILTVSPTQLYISGSYVSGAWTYAVGMTTYRTIELSVQGNNLLIYVDSVLRGNKTLTNLYPDKLLTFEHTLTAGTRAYYSTIAYGLLSRNTPPGA